MKDDRKTVFIADDEADALMEIKEALSGLYSIRIAFNGTEALHGVKRVKPDLAILDVVMPDMDGYEVLRRMKAEEETAKIPVILLTGKGGILDVENGFKAGADAYFVKPFSPAKLIAKIGEVFDKVEYMKRMRG